VIRWHDGDLGSSRDALTAVAVRAFLLGMLLGLARGLLAQRGPRATRPESQAAPPATPQDLRPGDGAPVEETLELEPMTVGRTR
jgi:hypothetical protein